MTRPRVVLAGGGTGGHVFPLVAIAHALRARCPEIQPIFVGTPRGMETRFVPDQGFELELLDVLPLRGGGPWGGLRGAVRAGRLLPQSRRLLDSYAPHGVLSIGGYAAGPVSLAAKIKGLPLALVEPNSVIGLTNRLIAPFVDRAYLAFEQTEKHFKSAVIRRSGVPLRPGFAPGPAPSRTGPLQILILGGSQGAKSLNEVLPRALAKVAGQVRVVHQCGAAHVDAVSAIYREVQQSKPSFAEVTPFIEDMAAALASADLVIARSGASAVSEIAAIGRPSLLVPYPYASGDHQRINALALQSKGAAICVESAQATVDRMAREISSLIQDRSRLLRMAEASRAVGRPDAADDIAKDFLELCGLSVVEGRRQGSAGGRSTCAPHFSQPEVA